MYVSTVIAGSSSSMFCWEDSYWLGKKVAFCHCGFCSPSLYTCLPSQVAQTVMNLSAMRETWVWSLGWEDPLVEGMATHSSILCPWVLWRTHGQRSLAGTVHGVTKSGTGLRVFHTYKHTIECRQKDWWAAVSKNLSYLGFQTQAIPVILAHP